MSRPTVERHGDHAAVPPPGPAGEPPRRPSRLRLQLVLLAVALVVSAFGAVAWANWFAPDQPLDAVLTEPGEYPLSGDSGNRAVSDEPLPVVGLVAADGGDVTLETDGRPLVVNVWASWCIPCERELQYFAAVDADYPDEQVRFVGVNNFPGDSLDDMVAFAAARGVGYELLHDSSGEFSAALPVVAMPLTLFVDGDGMIVSQSGQVDEAELRQLVAALAGAPGAGDDGS